MIPIQRSQQEIKKQAIVCNNVFDNVCDQVNADVWAHEPAFILQTYSVSRKKVLLINKSGSDLEFHPPL